MGQEDGRGQEEGTGQEEGRGQEEGKGKTDLVVIPSDAAAGGGVQVVLEPVVGEHLLDLHLLCIAEETHSY
jgi:hypothetical protein